MSKVIGWFRKKNAPKAKSEIKTDPKDDNFAEGDGQNIGSDDNSKDVEQNGKQTQQPEKDLFEQDVKKFLSLHIGTIANNLSLKDWAIYKNIKRQDIDERQSSHIVQQMKQNHKDIYLWTIDTILSGNNTKLRAKVIAQFLRIANSLLVHNNLNAAHAIVSALENFAVFRMDKSWKKLSNNKKKLFKTLKKLFADDEDNYFQLSLLMQDIQSVNNIFIPYLDLFLRDFENLLYLERDRRLLTIRRNAMIWRDINDRLPEFQSDTAQPELSPSYWIISEDKKCQLESVANERSRFLEPPKRFYKIMNVSEINLDDY